MIINNSSPAKSRGMSPETKTRIEQDMCFIIDNKAQFYYRKAGDDHYFAIFSPTHEITCIAGYLLTTDYAGMFSAP